MVFQSMIAVLINKDGDSDNLKLPWEIVFDIFLYVMTLSSAVVYTHFWFEGIQTFCVPAYNNTIGWPTPEFNYISSRCKFQSEIALVIYFPYCSLFVVGVLYVCHTFWRKLPDVKRKIRSFMSICKEICRLDRNVNINKNRLLHQFDFDQQSCDKIVFLQLQLKHILLDKSFVRSYFEYKTYITMMCGIVMTALMIVWMGSVQFFHTSFLCRLAPKLSKTFDMPFSCDTSMALPNYFIMILHFICVLSMTIIAVQAYQKNRHNKNPLLRIAEECFIQDYRSYPGYDDFIFLFMLLENNISDGGYHVNTVKKVIDFNEIHQRSQRNDRTIIPPGCVVEKNVITHEPTLSLHRLNVILKNINLYIHHSRSIYDYHKIEDCGYITDNIGHELLQVLQQLFNIIFRYSTNVNSDHLYQDLHKEIIKQKEYFLLMYNCIQLKNGNNSYCISFKQWHKFIVDINKLKRLNYIIIVSAFSNLYQVIVSILSFKTNKSNCIDVIYPYEMVVKPSHSHMNLLQSSNNSICPILQPHYYLVRIDSTFHLALPIDKSSQSHHILNSNFGDLQKNDKNIIRTLMSQYEEFLKRSHKISSQSKSSESEDSNDFIDNSLSQSL